MRAQDIMSRPVVTARPEMPAKRAAELLTEHGFTALPVVDEDERLVGIVTEADLIGDRFHHDPRYRTGRPVRPGATVGEVMTTPCTGTSPGCDLVELTKALLDARIRSMPVVEGSRLVGIVTRGDIVRTFARSDGDIAKDVRHHLSVYGGPERWRVEVHDGIVRVLDEFDDETDRHVATVLAEAVPGVVSASVTSDHEEKVR
ncbi:MAG TPA: CBS domain-containing protein [Mycobacteriales bacterium]|nr:CBS domain-containing protein [Mycobacteriales bacterium]